MKQAIQTLISQLELQPHPEGGYFRETYRSTGTIPKSHLIPEIEGERNYSTGIYFLLTSDNFSAFHKIRQDEMWHFYDGDPINLHMIDPEGNYSMQKIGRDIASGELPQFTVPAHVWFASEVSKADSWSLAGCTVSPGFDFRDFKMADREELIREFPEHVEVIERLTRAE